MSGKPNDGGPAFPYAFEHEEPPQSGFAPGMSLRDWFAGQALAGSMSVSVPEGTWPLNQPNPAAAVAMVSYAIADAMIAARGRATS